LENLSPNLHTGVGPPHRTRNGAPTGIHQRRRPTDRQIPPLRNVSPPPVPGRSYLSHRQSTPSGPPSAARHAALRCAAPQRLPPTIPANSDTIRRAVRRPTGRKPAPTPPTPSAQLQPPVVSRHVRQVAATVSRVARALAGAWVSACGACDEVLVGVDLGAWPG